MRFIWSSPALVAVAALLCGAKGCEDPESKDPASVAGAEAKAMVSVAGVITKLGAIDKKLDLHFDRLEKLNIPELLNALGEKMTNIEDQVEEVKDVLEKASDDVVEASRLSSNLIMGGAMGEEMPHSTLYHGESRDAKVLEHRQAMIGSIPRRSEEEKERVEAVDSRDDETDSQIAAVSKEHSRLNLSKEELVGMEDIDLLSDQIPGEESKELEEQLRQLQDEDLRRQQGEDSGFEHSDIHELDPEIDVTIV